MLSHQLSRFGLFSGVSPTALEPLESALLKREMGPDTTIFQRGESPSGFYLVLNGRVKVYRDSHRGQEQVLGFFGPGESFAEAAIFQPSYPASSSTLIKTELIFVEKERFLHRLAENPELSMRLLVGLASKQRRLVNLIEDLTLRDARGRLCHYLSGLLPPQGDKEAIVQLPVPQATLAQLLGITEETLSRSIRSLRKDGVLHPSTKGNFVVDDLDKLRTAYAI